MKRSTPNELPIPPDVLKNQRARELIRIWRSRGRLHYSIHPAAFKDSAAWGLLMADVLRLTVDALNEQYGFDKPGLTEAIRSRFEMEMESPTTELEGRYADGE